MSSSNNQRRLVRAKNNLRPRNVREVSRRNTLPGPVISLVILLAAILVYWWTVILMAH